MHIVQKRFIRRVLLCVDYEEVDIILYCVHKCANMLYVMYKYSVKSYYNNGHVHGSGIRVNTTT